MANMKSPPMGPSCLRTSNSRKGTITRNVSFPEDDSQIVTGILEPQNPWNNATNITNEDLISMYMMSCKKHGTYPLTTVLDQLTNLDLSLERNKIFLLKGVTLNAIVCETFEEILKHVQFCQIDLESTALDDEASVALFDMLEYYEAVTHLNISSNHNIGVRGWQACARMIKKAYCLEELEARNTTLNEMSMPILGRALKVGSQLQVLKLENCQLTGRPLIILASALKMNNNLKELYLSENGLSINDANQLASMLRCNTTLQLLDISHNEIKDIGMNYLVDGLIEQGFGLTVLMVWNNQLTRNVAYSVHRLLEESTSLETLNIGQNCLTDEFLRTIKDSLSNNKNILRIGLQTTSLTNESAFLLADILKRNYLIQRIDLRDNNIQASGLVAMLDCLKENATISRIDLDKIPRKSTFAENSSAKYKSLVEEIRSRCSENERLFIERCHSEANAERAAECAEQQDSVEELSDRTRQLKLPISDSRKISLTCESLAFKAAAPGDANAIACETTAAEQRLLNEPKRHGRLRSPAPSPIPSPVSSPSPSRSRFQVSKVSDQQTPTFCIPPTRPPSRFKVTVVHEPCPTKPTLVSREEEKKNECPLSSGTEREPSPKRQAKESMVNNRTFERMRKLSWVTPILQAPTAAIESANIPANLEKLIGLFHNPFMRNPTADHTKETSANKENTVDSGITSTSISGTHITNVSKKKEEYLGCDKRPASTAATWPQALSPVKSQSAAAYLLLQGTISTESIQNIPVVQAEKVTVEQS